MMGVAWMVQGNWLVNCPGLACVNPAAKHFYMFFFSFFFFFLHFYMKGIHLYSFMNSHSAVCWFLFSLFSYRNNMQCRGIKNRDCLPRTSSSGWSSCLLYTTVMYYLGYWKEAVISVALDFPMWPFSWSVNPSMLRSDGWWKTAGHVQSRRQSFTRYQKYVFGSSCSHGTGWGGVSALGLALFIFVLKWEAEKGNRG